MGMMNSVSSADVAADAQDLLHRIHAQLLAAFERHARAGRGLQALSADNIAPLREICDELVPEHFRLTAPEAGKASPSSSHGRRNCVRYQHIFENKLFSMGIFILPPGTSIPLHDHPDMSVISRVLYGRLHVMSCDLVSPKEAEHLLESRSDTSSSSSPVSPGLSAASPERRIARICQDEVVTAPYTTALLPDEGNLHEFVADPELGCAIFDILTPPYEPEDGRDCTYFRVMRAFKASGDGRAYAELEEFEPRNFEVASEPYYGPRLLAPSS